MEGVVKHIWSLWAQRRMLKFWLRPPVPESLHLPLVPVVSIFKTDVPPQILSDFSLQVETCFLLCFLKCKNTWFAVPVNRLCPFSVYWNVAKIELLEISWSIVGLALATAFHKFIGIRFLANAFHVEISCQLCEDAQCMMMIPYTTQWANSWKQKYYLFQYCWWICHEFDFPYNCFEVH